IAIGIPARLPRLVVAEAKSIRVRFLSHSGPLSVPASLAGFHRSPYRLPLLLAFLWRRLLAGKRFAHATRSATHALLRGGFRFNCRNSLRSSNVMLGNSHPQMRSTLLIAKRSAHRGGTQPLPARPLVHEAVGYVELVDVQRGAGIVGLPFGIGDSAAQHFFDVLGSTLGRKPQS